MPTRESSGFTKGRLGCIERLKAKAAIVFDRFSHKRSTTGSRITQEGRGGEGNNKKKKNCLAVQQIIAGVVLSVCRKERRHIKVRDCW